MKKLKLIVLFLFISIFLTAQNAERKFESYKQEESHLTIYTNDGMYTIKPYSDKIVETSFVPIGENFNKNSHAVVLVPMPVLATINEYENSLEYSTKGIVITIQKSPFKISYSYKSKPIISEKKGYVKTDSTEILEFNLDKNEVLYGGGERVLGMNRRGNRLQLYNRAHYGYTTHSELMNYTMPLAMSSKMYAIHFDNAPIGFLDLDSKNDNTLSYETISGRKTYQVIVGDSWEDLINNYTDLTGKQPLPPRWALGNFASRFGYHSEREVRETVDGFLKEKIPLDAVILDLYWFGKEVKGTMGNLEFDKDSFPTPKKMIADFKNKGVKTILITEPFILTTSNRWDEAVNKKILATDSVGKPYTYDFFFGNTGLIDIFKKEGNNWFWNIYKDLAQAGVRGWWGDLGEPEVHPSDLKHASGSADELHNIYGHNWAKLIFEGYQEDFPNQRPFILMRSGYSGTQRFGIIPWSGDVSRSWGGLQAQTEIALQMGMQGIGYMHSDLGGFAGDLDDTELYTRWLQYGVFQPVFRPHAQEDVASEPIFKDDKTKSLAKKAVELRYSLLPYNYTLAFENNQYGLPLMRPLLFEEPNNNELHSESNTYLWGEDFLVSPVVEKSKTEQEIYFPIQNNWIDFYTDKVYQGGTKQIINLVEDHIPVFVRSGAFIPMVKPVQSTDNYSTSNLELHFYHDELIIQSEGELYDDDGITPNAFEKGKYELLQFNSNFIKQNLIFKFSSTVGNSYKQKSRKVNFSIHQIITKPKQVKINNKKVDFIWSEKDEIILVPVDWKIGEVKEIKIKLNRSK